MNSLDFFNYYATGHKKPSLLIWINQECKCINYKQWLTLPAVKFTLDAYGFDCVKISDKVERI